MKMVEDIDRKIFLRMENYQKKAIKEREKSRLSRLKKGSPDNIYEDGYNTGKVATIGLMMLLFAQMKMEHEQLILMRGNGIKYPYTKKEYDKLESDLSKL